MAELWVDKYQPRTMDQYIWHDERQRSIVEQWLEEKAIPHVMFSGIHGTGKSSLAKLLFLLLDVQDGDILEINASKDRTIEVVRDKINNFVSTWPIGPCKYVLLEEADAMNTFAQDALKSEIERFSNEVRFIFTCNDPKKISGPLHSRVEHFQFSALNHNEFTGRVFEVLIAEDIEFEIATAEGFIAQAYPDMRKCITLLHQNTHKGKDGVRRLLEPIVVDPFNKEYIVEAVALFKAGKFLDARTLIVRHAKIEEYPDIYRFFYRNLDLWGSTQKAQDEAVVIIADGLRDHAIALDAEINITKTIIQLQYIEK